MNLKLELIFKDRVGIVADLSSVIAQQGGNITSMEVIPCLQQLSLVLSHQALDSIEFLC